jgi:hypothetical protein
LAAAGLADGVPVEDDGRLSPMTGFSGVGERREFFVSYTAADREWAEWIAWQLEDAGYSVLLRAWDMVTGSNWLRMMNQATRFAERTVAVLSAAYLDDSAFGAAEWLAAYQRDPAGLASRVIPVRVEDCTVDGLLGGIVYADLVGLPDKAAARTVLLQAVRAAVARRSKPPMEPGFPGAGSVGEAPAEPDTSPSDPKVADPGPSNDLSARRTGVLRLGGYPTADPPSEPAPDPEPGPTALPRDETNS